MFLEYKDYLSIFLETHVKIFTYVKYNKTKDRIILYSDDTVARVEDYISKEKNNEYKSILKAYKERLIERILKSEDFIKDKWFNRTPFYEIVLDDNRDAVERLTILSIFSIFSGPNGSRLENESEFTQKMFESIYDRNGELNIIEKETEIKQRFALDSQSIIKAGAYWYSKQITEGNRFNILISERGIIPLDIYVYSEDKKELKLSDAIENTSEHLYLVGEGGIGKSTSLFKIMKSFYGPETAEVQANKQIPFFIELSNAYAPEDFKHGSSIFIRHSIQRQIQDSIKKKIDLMDQLDELMSYPAQGEEPEFVLLLDGLNEVSREKIDGAIIAEMVKSEIGRIINDWKNVRVILTGRIKEDSIDNVSTLDISGIKPEAVIEYLEKSGIPEKRKRAALKNNGLLEVLRIPLFLVLYVNTNGEDELLNRGEIFHAFFTKNNPVYSMRERVLNIRKTLKATRSTTDDSITPQMFCFMLDFIMPSIAWKMVQDNKNRISKEDIGKCVQELFILDGDYPDTSCCGQYGNDCFSEYDNKFDEDTGRIADEIVNLRGKKYKDITILVRECLGNQLGVLVRSGNEDYKTHQNIRDYFAALYHINRLRLAVYINENAKISGSRDLAKECLKEWIDEPLPKPVLTFIGEALGEERNMPEFDDKKGIWNDKISKQGRERSLISRGLNIFRNSDNNKGYTVWNLLQILKLVRKDLSGENLSFLDLSDCEFNGYHLARGNIAADLTGAKVSDRTFLPQGHGSVVNTAFFSPGIIDEQDGKKKSEYIITASGDRMAKVFDAKTYQEKYTLSGHSNVLYFAGFSPDAKLIITTSRDGTLKIWDTAAFEEKKTISFDTPVYFASFNNLSTKIAIALKSGKVFVYDIETGEKKEIELRSVKNAKKKTSVIKSVNKVLYSTSGKYILVASNDCTARVIDAETCEEIPESVLVHDSEVLYSEFNSDDTQIVTSCKDGSVNVWDMEDPENPEKLSNTDADNVMMHDGDVYFAVFSPDGSKIASASKDGRLKIWDSSKLKELKTINFFTSVNSAQFDSNGEKIIVSFDDHTFKVIDAISYEELTSSVEMSELNAVYSAQFSPDAGSIVTALANDTIEVWNRDKEGKYVCSKEYGGHTSSVYSTQFSPEDGRYIVSSSSDNSIIIRECTDPVRKDDYDNILINKEVHSGAVNSVEWDPAGSGNLVSASSDGTVKIWNWDRETVDLKLAEEPLVFNRPVAAASYSKDGKRIVIASGSCVSVFDVEKHKIISQIDAGQQKTVRSVSFSPDAKHVLSAFGEKTVKEWKLIKGKLEPEQEYQMDIAVNDARYLDGKQGYYIITAGADGSIRFWHSSKPDKTRELTPKQIGGVRLLRFSKKQKYLVSSSDAGIAVVWSVEHNEPDNDADCLEIQRIDTIRRIPGVYVSGVDFSKISDSSDLSDKVKWYLEEQGAIVVKPEHKDHTLTKKNVKRYKR